MPELSTAKTLGIVGVILTLIGAFATPIREASFLSIVGLIFILIAVKIISDTTGKPEIFKNYVISVVLEIIAILVFILVILATITSTVGFHPRHMSPETVISALAGVLTAFILFYILLVAGTYFLKKAYDTIAIEVGVGWFHTAALLYFIGAILVIIVVGVFLILIGLIIELIAWISLPETLPKKTRETTIPESQQEQQGPVNHQSCNQNPSS